MPLARFRFLADDVISRFQVSQFSYDCGLFAVTDCQRRRSSLDHQIASLRASLRRAFLEGLRELRYKNIVSERRHAAGWLKTLREMLRSYSQAPW
jgi:hypothetical protein